MSGILFLLSGLPSESYLVLKNNPLYIFLPFFKGCNNMKPVHLTMNPSSVSPNCDEATLIGNRTSAMSTTSWWLHNYSTCSEINMIDGCMLLVIIKHFSAFKYHVILCTISRVLASSLSSSPPTSMSRPLCRTTAEWSALSRLK